MSAFRADLHCHTTCSDGTLTPQELVEHAVAVGLQGLAITDHDTVAAYDDEDAMKVAAQNQLQLISGVEFSSKHRGKTVHVLGYSFKLDSADIRELCARHVARRQERNRAILEKLKQAGMPLSEEELEQVAGGAESIGRPHIAQLLVKHGYAKHLEEAFKRYIGDRKPYYVDGRYPSTEETIEVIHKAKGLAVLAHPHLLKDEAVLKELVQLPFDGLEAHYARFHPHQEKRWLDLAEELGWLATGGSDFHGEIKPNNPLGCSWVSEQNFDLLQGLYLKNCRP